MLYSLLHLGGFPGDVDFYRGRTAGAARILELGAGDGRVGAVLCADAQYTGVEICAEFATAARERVDGTVLEADMFAPLPEGTAPFNAVVLCANTLFCTPRHAELLARCSEAMAPGGTLLFDVYNAAPWHEEALYIAGGGSAEDGPEVRQRAKGEEGEEGDEGEESEESGEESGEGGVGGEGGEFKEDPDLLVRAIDEAGRKWTVFERDPKVDAAKREIVCAYDFEAESGERASQANTHHYALPEQLRAMLDAAGFEIEATFGGFEGEAFDEEESDHLIFAARLRD
tara:strand:+ start:125 stop:982 length:858 start_codon:yes stop_codon:yes gene_type:complete